jgi:small subunit ribosomal protein S6
MTTADLQHEYETFYVTKPELPDDEVTRISEKLLGAIERLKGSLLVSEDWGRRKLSYPIARQNHGHYIYMNYVGPAALPVELERSMGLEDNLIRFLTVKLGEDVDVEERRVMAQERTRIRAERLAAQRAEEEERAKMEAEYASERDDRRRERDERNRRDDDEFDPDAVDLDADVDEEEIE